MKWLKINEGETFESPRSKTFSARAKQKKYDLKVVSVSSNRVNIDFVGSKYHALPLYFWMFDRTLDYLRENKDRPVRLGAKINPPYKPDTIEEQIWKGEGGICPYKAAPHICDILALAGLVEYILIVDPETERKVQGVRLIVEK